MIPMYQIPLIEPMPLPPGASPSDRLEYNRQMSIYRAQVIERKQQRDWDIAFHVVVGIILVLMAAALLVGTIYLMAGFRGLAIAVTASLAFWLAVVEVKRRL